MNINVDNNSIQPRNNSIQPLYRQDVPKGMNMNVANQNSKNNDSTMKVPYWIDGRLVMPHDWLNEQKIKKLEKAEASMIDYGKIPYYGGSKYTRKIKRPLK